ncbi:Tyrosyl-DNA phosphodiesterase [Paramyrothecium foliicola]|nr:Tyrosyl-DNA phosphodiesterase [Paramyrothecium foliicola]
MTLLYATTMNLHDWNGDADEDEALQHALSLSLQDQDEMQTHDTDSTGKDTKDTNSPRPSTQKTQAPFGSVPLDRKKMEEERLQRLAKRRRPASDDDVVEVPPPKRSAQLKTSTFEVKVPFPDGAIKRTWARGFPRSTDDIKIEEVLQKDQLLLAVLSSFQWDEEWLMSKLNLSQTKVLLIAFAADDAQKNAMQTNVPAGFKFCFPPMIGPGSMHSKLQLLKYPDYIRVVIPTGNLVPYDWGESGVMENMVFLLDLPRLVNSVEHRPTMFSTELDKFLRAAGVDDRMVNSLTNYDFSRTSNLGFVCTIPGGHTGGALKHIGYSGLGSAVAALGLATADPVEVDLVVFYVRRRCATRADGAQCASLGSINGDLINAIYNACQGDDGMKEYQARTTRKPASKPRGITPLLKDRFRIYFPTDRTVRDSRGGKPAGGTICVQEKWWNAPAFPRELVRDCINTRDGLLMHSKMIFVRKTGGSSLDQATSSGWAYVGSANLSESAWGRIVKDRSSGTAKMSCRNWECGVVVPIPSKQDGNVGNGMGMFSGRVPVPMQTPGPSYGPGDKPWLFLKA